MIRGSEIKSDMRKSWKERFKCDDYGEPGGLESKKFLKGDFKGETPDWQVKSHSRKQGIEWLFPLPGYKNETDKRQNRKEEKDNKNFFKKISENYWQKERSVVI